jgi:hypothetical protein
MDIKPIASAAILLAFSTNVTASPLTISSDVTAPGNITLTASESAAAGDDLTYNAGVFVTSTGTCN